MAESHYTSCQGKKIHYTIRGKSNKTLVLLHGFLENLSMWNKYSKEFEKNFNVIAIDIPGHGKSDVIHEVHSTNLMADAVDTVLKKENIKSAFFVGHSMGGYIALAYGERYSEKTEGVILLNSTTYADSEIKKADRDRAIKVMQKNASIFIQEAIPNLFADENREKFKEDIDRIIAEALEISLEGACAALRGMKVREDKSHLLQKNKFPIHFIAGEKDNVIPFEKVKEQVQLNATIKLVSFPNSGHMSFLEEEKDCLAAIFHLLK